jgi:hypothetical protein
MSAQFEVAGAELVPGAPVESAAVAAMELAWREAWEERGRAAARGDYAAAERWYDRARELAALLDAGKRDMVVAPPR